jgi:NADPH:quinone reductase-like Zn-dependent oxidoreductase
MARAVGIERPGGPEVLTVIDREVREPGPGEVRIAVKAAAVNPTDIGLRNGGGATPPPWIPGMDAAGTIEAVGEGVGRLAVGEEVMAVVTPRRPHGGAQTELLVVEASSGVPIPSGVTLHQAATLPMNGLTAMAGLDLIGLPPGATLGVTGGAGLLASYVIPLAHERAMRVIADAKPEDADLVRGFGADVVVPRGEPFPEQVDAVFDTAMLHAATFDAIRDGGKLVVVRGWQPDTAPPRGIEVVPVRVAAALQRTDWLLELRQMASEGRLALRVAGEYPPEQAAEAQRVTDAGGIRGRALIVF